jgi:hypothetical protein
MEWKNGREKRERRTGLANNPLALMTPSTPVFRLISTASCKLNTSPFATIGTAPFAQLAAKAIRSRLTG